MSIKKYGLVLPEKGKQLQFQAKRNVFGDDSDPEEQSSKKLMLLRPSHNINRQAKLTQEKALTEDPTVYQYDEVYDDMVVTKQQEKKKDREDKKPRYIENLIKTANKRKIENERRIERQIQKERENEGEEFKDKEVFVTSAYKKKLEDMREEEEREKREEYLENIGDVTKQKDLGGFYRHLYEQKLGSNKPLVEEKQDNDPNGSKIKNIAVSPVKSDFIKKRNYRKRKSVEEKNLSEGEIDDSEEEINRLNLDDIKLSKKSKTIEENIDADSDFSTNESSDEESKSDKEIKENKQNTPERENKSVEETKTQVTTSINNSEIVEVKEKIDIWKKRTVGEAFEQALKRYYERKAARGS